ncbi:MAG: HAMP domain-containing protein [Gammaproteobacteria bacterium]|jgi:adenylate cyclase|nr:HAMP domain-containing protein [Gammaproteobacteria bacterium]MBT3867427.1 HAMP domain-containing protein [Gammaproteobacteria bacterium]MBT4377580.1 HAMP domain-containing protein [Gammaproteobacteria bacterium]MBT4616172.1 HAMP domain-containing protein [Gammaproteobacteria bacterium]MBT5196411.1 HAMP domain-containing protein [Gammaproteobacteria bacterium]
MSFNRTKSIPLLIRLTVLISLLVFSSISLISLTTMSKQGDLQSSQIRDFGHAMAMQLAASATEPLFTEDNLSLELQLINFLNLPRVQGGAIFDAEQNTLMTKGDIGTEPSLHILLQESQTRLAPVSRSDADNMLQVVAPIVFRDVTAGFVAINLKAESIAKAYTDMLVLLLVVAVALAAVAAVAAYYISRHVSRPISHLLAATHQFEAGNYEVKVKERRYDEIGRLTEAINSMSQGLYRKNQVESLLDQFLAKDIANEVLRQLDTVQVGGERVTATVLFVDIVGFTNRSEKMSPEEVADFLNEWFNYFIVCARMYFGTVDKFIGDCAMVVFGAPKENPNHQFHAVACAVLMQKLARSHNARRRLKDQPPVELRIGINTGQMLAGILGTQQRKEYTVVGDSVNLASRLCSEAEAGQTIISQDFFQTLSAEHKIVAQAHRKNSIRGKEIPIDTYIVEDVEKEYQRAMDSLIEDVLSSN